MHPFIEYLWKANLIWISLYVVYGLLLKKDTFFSWNRAYLLVSSVLAVTLPLFSFELAWFQDKIPVGEVQLLLEDTFAEEKNTTTIIIPSATIAVKPLQKEIHTWLSWAVLAWSIYVAGVVFNSIKLLKSIFEIIKLAKQFKIEKLPQGIWQVHIDQDTPIFTFLNCLFWHEPTHLSPQERQQIWVHELTHIQQWHSLDILLIELLHIIFWFNPVGFAYKKSLQNIHEYLADEAALGMHNNKKEYSHLLVNHFLQTSVLPLAHSFFNTSLLKQRIMMIQKNPSHRFNFLKFGAVLPVFALCLAVFACSQELYVVNAPEIEQRKAQMKKYDYTKIDVLPFDKNNAVEFEVNGKCNLGITVAAMQKNYDKISLDYYINGTKVSTLPLLEDKENLFMLGRLEENKLNNIKIVAVLQDGTSPKNMFLVVGQSPITPPTPVTAGSLQIEASGSQPSEVTMTLRNDLDYTFQVTKGNAVLVFKESFGAVFSPDYMGVVKISPQKDIGGDLVISTEGGEAVVTMSYTPR